jgi:hypothetical protein
VIIGAIASFAVCRRSIGARSLSSWTRSSSAVIPHGSPERIAEAVRAHFEAGADHVALPPLGHGPAPIADYEALARALL